MITRKKISIAVGIPAYNEEGNIQDLLRAILSQQLSRFVIKEIIVSSDGSTDRTCEKVRALKDQRIVLFDHKKRIGQIRGQKEICSYHSSDILVLLNADVIPHDIHFIEKLCSHFLSEKRPDLIGAKVIPLPAETFIEKIINTSHELKTAIYESFPGCDTVYLCHGRARAFSRKLSKSLPWPSILSEDSFSYLWAKEHNFRFAYAKDAKVFFRSPKTIKDHFKQSTRFFQFNIELGKYFSDTYITSAFYIPPKILLRKIVYFLLVRPIPTYCYLCITFGNRFLAFLGVEERSVLFTPSYSSKVLRESHP